ncbi:hypothetical protein C9374_004032 [Naegleria lovaniensis]|uniref:Serpin domain-containing protein n=1 Tax=Naegleria lovaniensis TaxID=51637 RepID=A0AA88KQI3_NAELO|nr:uncharacterized protein C9374_004032 [Naegleria lovaniensis]KAG2394268.1 hypothetical protein C9374_004032 [Naegleria lovaniensis]
MPKELNTANKQLQPRISTTKSKTQQGSKNHTESTPQFTVAIDKSHENKLQTAQNAVGSVMLSQLMKQNSNGASLSNLVFSPFSFFHVMLMILMGSKDETLSELVHALQLKESMMVSCSEGCSSEQELNPLQYWKMEHLECYMNTCMKYFKMTSSEETSANVESSSTPISVSLSVANRLFLEQSLNVKLEYLSELKQYFNSEPELCNFKEQPMEQVQKINSWIESKTNGRIPNMLSSSDVSESTSLILVNAIHFLGTWMHKFNINRTNPRASFRTLMDPTGETTKCERMSMFSSGGIILSIPLTVESEQEFDEWFLSKLANVKQITPTTRLKFRKVEIPKFNMEVKENLTDVLKSSPLNMQHAFSPLQANFTGISENVNGQRIFISKIIQKVYIKADEDGTEAAACTMVGLGKGGARRSQTTEKLYEFVVDRPFAFVLHHLPTKSVLFCGKINSFSSGQ